MPASQLPCGWCTRQPPCMPNAQRMRATSALTTLRTCVAESGWRNICSVRDSCFAPERARISSVCVVRILRRTIAGRYEIIASSEQTNRLGDDQLIRSPKFHVPACLRQTFSSFKAGANINRASFVEAGIHRMSTTKSRLSVQAKGDSPRRSPQD